VAYFPFFFDLKKFRILIVGGGEIALNKVRLLSQYQATLTVVSLQIKPEIEALLAPSLEQPHRLYQRAFQAEDLDEVDIVIVATDDDDFNTSVWELAKQKNKIVNVVDDREKCDFIFPALVNRGDLTVAISTSGVAPTVASWLRSKLETELPQSWTAIMASLKKQQPLIRQTLPNVNHRRRFYRSLIDFVLPYFLRSQQNENNNTTATEGKIADSIENHLHTCSQSTEGQIPHIKQPKVYLVGAGPGDPELLTLRAQQVLQQADIVLYDRLLSDDLLDYTRRDAQKIFVGKKANNHTKTQEQINKLLLEYAKKGNIVVRLKGGDPFIFGRGGEEMAILQQHQIEVEIIPGVSAVNGVAANLGIPLTLRGVSDKLLLTSIYATQTHQVNWQQLALPKQTLVLYMGLQNIAQITTNLIDNGLSKATPIALIEKGTWRDQKVVYTTLEQTQSQAYLKQINLQSPVLSIIGEVVNHRKK
jgi:uroporphyrin-III C-methyltransferase/precorrin-2 dehydrogenase/sirohydrochlorin ferrochelatase